NRRIETTLKLFGTRLEQLGRGVPMMAAALSTFLAGMEQIVVAVGEATDEAFERNVALRYLPFAIRLRITPAVASRLADRLPVVAAMHPLNGRTAVYVCRDFACRQPVTTDAELAAQFEDARRS